MKKLLLLAALLGYTFAMPVQLAFAGQDDCAEGQTWNEDTQKCEQS